MNINERECRNPSVRAGFTLIELLIVVTISSILIGVIVSAFAGGIKVWELASNFDSRRMEALVAVEMMEKEIHNAVQFGRLGLVGDESSMVLATSPGVDGPGGRTVVVEYWFDEAAARLYKRTRRHPFDDGASSSEVVLSNVRDALFSYARAVGVQGLVWGHSWPSGVERSGELPAGVRVEVDIGGENEVIKLNKSIYRPGA